MTARIRRALAMTLGLAASTTLIGAQEQAQYRTYHLGQDAVTIARQLGVPAPAVTLMPRALGAVEEVRWRAQYGRRGVSSPGDPVSALVFSFYEGQLFRIVIDYAHDRTEGMTAGDIVAAVSKVYGPPARRLDPPSPVGLHPQRPEDTVIAQWTGADRQLALLAIQDQTAYRLIVTSPAREAIARAGGAHEAPVVLLDWAAIESDNLAADVELTTPAREKIRRANIAAFVP